MLEYSIFIAKLCHHSALSYAIYRALLKPLLQPILSTIKSIFLRMKNERQFSSAGKELCKAGHVGAVPSLPKALIQFEVAKFLTDDTSLQSKFTAGWETEEKYVDLLFQKRACQSSPTPNPVTAAPRMRNIALIAKQ